jgi:hypothetical protein
MSRRRSAAEAAEGRLRNGGDLDPRAGVLDASSSSAMRAAHRQEARPSHPEGAREVGSGGQVSSMPGHEVDHLVVLRVLGALEIPLPRDFVVLGLAAFGSVRLLSSPMARSAE